MGRIRTGIWILILIILTVLFFQNQSAFLSSRSLSLNLYFVKYQTPELPDGLYFLAALIIGLLIAYLFSLADRFKARRALKGLSAVLDDRQQEVMRLKKEIEDLKQQAAAPEPPPVIPPPVEDEKPVSETITDTPAETPPSPDTADETNASDVAEAKKGVEY